MHKSKRVDKEFQEMPSQMKNLIKKTYNKKM